MSHHTLARTHTWTKNKNDEKSDTHNTHKNIKRKKPNQIIFYSCTFSRIYYCHQCTTFVNIVFLLLPLLHACVCVCCILCCCSYCYFPFLSRLCDYVCFAVAAVVVFLVSFAVALFFVLLLYNERSFLFARSLAGSASYLALLDKRHKHTLLRWAKGVHFKMRVRTMTRNCWYSFPRWLFHSNRNCEWVSIVIWIFCFIKYLKSRH